MSFSDSDLARLKDEAWDYKDGSRLMWVKGPALLSLLARLECAERYIDHMENEDCMRPDNCSYRKDFLKASGKYAEGSSPKEGR